MTSLRRMLLHVSILLVTAAPFGSSANSQTFSSTSGPVPIWAFLWDPSVKVPPPDDEPNRLPGSDAAFSWRQARDLFSALDWHPGDHPPMPAVVMSGRKPDVRACGACHRVEGTGGPENASLAGLPVDYLVKQLSDFRSGARRMSGPERPPTLMVTSAKGMSDAEIFEAAQYFASLKPKQVIRVVEGDTIPKTGPSRMFYVRSPDGGSEPLGQRIVEMPDDSNQFELRDSHATFTAYVPAGSIAKGEALATNKEMRLAAACNLCHGADLRGAGAIPPLAGRSPTYIVRQLVEFQNGGRAGSDSLLMKPIVEKLSSDDMIALAAYLGSLAP